MAFIASEPITGSKTDWVAVPPNHALVFTREKSGYLNVMRTPINPLADTCSPQQQEVSRCGAAGCRGGGRGRCGGRQEEGLAALLAGPAKGLPSCSHAATQGGGRRSGVRSAAAAAAARPARRCLEAISRGLTAKSRTFKMLRTAAPKLEDDDSGGRRAVAGLVGCWHLAGNGWLGPGAGALEA